jgi:hypothetical protein
MKKYEIIWDEENLIMKRLNDGFNPMELIGVLEITLENIKEQMLNKDNSPITVEKKVIKK